LCEQLVWDGHDVICIDNYSTVSKDNVLHLMRYSNFELLPHDVTFPLCVEIDEIYSLACPASPVHYQLDPVQTTKSSVHGAINIGEADEGKDTSRHRPVRSMAIRMFTRARTRRTAPTDPQANPGEFFNGLLGQKS
jgi:nucleoside-diphosphate-sugar epimerase